MEKSFDRCPKCERYDYLNRHKCPPAFSVWSDEGGGEESARQIHSYFPEDAATKWAERYDEAEGEYAIVGSNEHFEWSVNVRGTDGAVSKFLVSGRMEPQYTAIPAKEQGS